MRAMLVAVAATNIGLVNFDDADGLAELI